MPFKDDDSGKTNNIYMQWCDTAGGDSCDEPYVLRYLEEFTLEELQHLKWLIEQQIKVRDKQDGL